MVALCNQSSVSLGGVKEVVANRWPTSPAAVAVERIAPGGRRTGAVDRDVGRAHANVPGARWTGVVGTIHRNVSGLRCWYCFPGTSAPTSDAETFACTSYPADAIRCDDRVAWIGR
jgi:hypothetical protein